MFLLRAGVSVLLVAFGYCLPMNLGDAPLYTKGLFQGDIIAFNDPNDRASIVDADLLWPGGVVPYVIGPTAQSLREYILAGMEEYHQKTCIRFVEKTPDMHDYVQIEWWQGCNSMVGRMGGVQYLSLGNGCHWKGLVVHELGHALGFYHEQARSDRDAYLEILWDNILPDFKDQFVTMKHYEHNLLNEKFDYKSIMLYEETAFSKDGESPTVRVKQEGVVIGPVWQKPGLSESDVRRVNKLYQCFGEVRPDPPEVPDIVCGFEQDDCEFVNQENMGSDYERLYTTLGGRTGYFMVADGTKLGTSIGARLISPYFKLYGRLNGCLSFDYFTGGEGVWQFTVDKQGQDTIQVIDDKESREAWLTTYIPIKKSEGDQRFFFTATFRHFGVQAKYAMDNIKFTLSECPKQ